MDATQICGLLDADLVNFIHNVIVLLKIAVPVILVILGMLDFAKGVMANKEDEIKKGQQVFIKRLIAAALVFFVVTIVQLVMGIVSKDDGGVWDCANGILNGTAGTKYEPTGVTGKNSENVNSSEDNNFNSKINNDNNNSNDNNNASILNNDSNSTNNNEKLPSNQQQVGEDYQGEGLTNNENINNNENTITTTTTNPDVSGAGRSF